LASLKGHSLDRIFGTHANVRVLRALVAGGEHAPPRIARETKISRPAVREALIRLETEGIVERIGDGRSVLYRISLDHPLAKRIVKLFKTEARRGVIAGALLLCASSLVPSLAPSLRAQAASRKPADLIVTGGHIYTVDDSRPAAQAFAVRDGIFAFVGSTSEAMTLKGPGTRVIDLHGATVVPGLADAHGHLSGLAEFLHDADLTGSLSYEEVIARTVQHAGKPAKGEWVIGHGWDQNRWAVKQFPTSDALTRAFPDNPAMLERIDGHALLANARAMQLAGISAATKDPVGGRIIRDASGNPSGVFVDNAERLIQRVIPGPTAAQFEKELTAAIAECNRWGLVSVHDPGESRQVIDAMEAMARRNEFNLRGYLLISDDSAAIAHYYSIGPRSALYGGHIWVRAIKLYADGALGSRGAALLSPYSDDPGNTGLLVSTEAHLQAVATSALQHGFQVATHAIGDRGNRNALDAYEGALKAVPTADHRFRIEHAQILDPADIPRFAELGVIPSMQASHQTSDMRWAEDRLGPSRIRGAYAWRSLLNTGVIIPNGTDFPVERVNPLITFHSAITRSDSTGWPDGGWYPEQRMTRDEALRSMTIWAAYAGFQEQLMGSITPGKYADFTVLDQDIMTIPAADILKTSVVSTYIGGKSVYERNKQ
jgi:predicted amidohydrolase YtcJ/DNA-binding transcriptional ArsR family regulator